MATSNDLLRVLVSPPEIRPTGITPAVTVGGKVQTQTQGRGEGIFSGIVNTLGLVYSGFKGATVGQVTPSAQKAGTLTGTGNFQTTFASDTTEVGFFDQKFLGIKIGHILILLVLFKLFLWRK